MLDVILQNMILPAEFYHQDTLTLSKKLLGTYLVSNLSEGQCIGRIVETESYLANDPAAHSYIGQTARNEVLFGQPGFVYVYFIYGLYYCVNVTAGQIGVGEAVLIRALEPIEGVELMKKRRKSDNLFNLCNGPGKLTQALGIDLKLNKTDLTQGPLTIISSDSFPEIHPENESWEIVETTRIGISKAVEAKWRFYIKGNRFISKV